VTETVLKVPVEEVVEEVEVEEDVNFIPLLRCDPEFMSPDWGLKVKKVYDREVHSVYFLLGVSTPRGWKVEEPSTKLLHKFYPVVPAHPDPSCRPVVVLVGPCDPGELGVFLRINK